MEGKGRGGEEGEDVRPLTALPCSFEELNLPPWLCACLKGEENVVGAGKGRRGGEGKRKAGFGYCRPTPVQQCVIPLCRYNRHLVVQAKSGTGKTIAFACTAVLKAASGGGGAPNAGGCWAIILAPTRELALQHEAIVRKMAKWAPKPLKVLCCVGGQTGKKSTHERENETMARMLEGAAERGVLCATPGRLSAVLASRNFSRETTRRIRCVVLDEADRLMDGNYDDHLGGFLSCVPGRAQVLCFSATYTERLLHRIENITGRTNFVTPQMRREGDPKAEAGGNAGRASEGATSDVGGGESSFEGPREVIEGAGRREHGGDVVYDAGEFDRVSLKRVKQCYHECADLAAASAGAAGNGAAQDDRAGAFDLKVNCLIKQVLSSLSFDQAILFCNSKPLCLLLHKKLAQTGFNGCFVLHGEMPQSQRNHTMALMRQRKGRVLVATDLVSRGIDLPQVDLVVNMDLPREGTTLMHRVGRTGRFGKEGMAVHLLCPGELGKLFDLLKQGGAHSANPQPLFSEPAEFRPPPDEEGGDVRGRPESAEKAKPMQTEVEDLPEHVQRWLWWKWRYLWWQTVWGQRRL
ncbi:DEAD/DEAH box RNA helicase [Chloropicon primus]|nr:DEAD/DEAH box RNA helicase [Chloropicon primus]